MSLLGARARVALSGLTVAEHFREEGQDVLFFVDNIFFDLLKLVQKSPLY